MFHQSSMPSGAKSWIVGGAIRILPGQYYDKETLTHYNYFRDYNPKTGRYIESDPLGVDGLIKRSGVLNESVRTDAGVDFTLISAPDLNQFPSVVEPNVESGNYRRMPSINLYSYADSNPINLIDPMGLAPSLPGFVACVRACNEARTRLARICTWCGPYSRICLAFSLARHALCIANCQAKFTNPPKK
jgi:RHS repeat-associated protein